MTAAALGALVLFVTASPAAPLPAPCDGPDVDPWVVGMRDRTLQFNGLAAFAVGVWSDPIACDGVVTSEFDGARYGLLTLSFAAGVELVVETQPIETSIVTLRSPAGFSDRAAVEAAFRDYVAGIGVDIDWATPEVTTDGADTDTTFWDPGPGLNAAASLVTSGDRLVAVRFSMAL